MYLEIFALLILNCFVIIGFNRATYFEYLDEDHPEHGIVNNSKMVLWKFRKWCVDKFGYFWSKPLCTCPACMSSVHSIYVYWLLMPFTLHSLYMYPVYILALSGIVYSYSNVILKD